MTHLPTLTVEELLDEFRTGSLSPVEVLDAVASRIDAVDDEVGGFTALCLDRARDEARAAEAAWRRGEARPLEGIPFGGQGPVRQRRRPNGVRLTDVRGARSRAGRRGGAARPCGGRDPRRQDADARVRVGDHVRQPRARLGSQPVGARPSLRRLERRLRRRARDGRGAARARQRHGGLDPRSRRVLRGRRAQADVRPHQRRPAPGRSPGRSTTPGRWRDRPRTPRSCSRRLPASTRTIPRRSDVPLGDVRAELPRGLDGLVVGLCPDLHLVPLAPDVRERLRGGDFGRWQPPVHGSSRCALPEAELILPAFRTIQSAEALDTHRRAGLYPERRDEYGPDVLGRLDAADRGDARAVPRGVRGPAARPRGVRARCSAPATCSSRRSARARRSRSARRPSCTRASS